MADSLGVSLRPMHPGAEDPLLLPHFSAEVADPDEAERVAAGLRKSGAVDAAFYKPQAGLP